MNVCDVNLRITVPLNIDIHVLNTKINHYDHILLNTISNI